MERHVPPSAEIKRIFSERSGTLAVTQLNRTFQTEHGAVEALRGIDLAVEPSEFLCIVGPSGCGKSTLLNLIAGLDRPTSGSIAKAGVQITGPGTDRVVVFQESALFPWLNVIQNVEFGLKIQGIPAAKRRRIAEEHLELVGLSKFRNAYPHELSGGMKQRVAIARGLVLNPDVLLMDEPFAALDAQTRDSLHGELQRIWMQTRKTIIFVTHNVREAACLGDRILLLSPHPGRVHREYRIDLPRPRSIEHPQVMEVAREVLADLRNVASTNAPEAGRKAA